MIMVVREVSVSKANNKINFKKSIEKNKLFIIVFFIAMFLRLFMLGNIPGDSTVYVDEAFSAYEAYSIFETGSDVHGYHNPVYLMSWGSGMSVMQSYLMIPFIAMFGLTSLAIRLPMAILSIIAVICWYKIGCIIRGRGFGLLTMSMFAIMPWNIMMARWALDCNMFVSFMSVFLLFFYMSINEVNDNKKRGIYLVLSALFFGLSLYTYAAMWTIMPLLIFSLVIYYLYKRRMRLDIYFIISAVLVALLAVPLILFIFVNFEIMDPIITDFISIPKIYFRNSDLSGSFKSIITRAQDFFIMLIKQDDGRKLNVTKYYGLFYPFGMALALIGMGFSLHKAMDKYFGFLWSSSEDRKDTEASTKEDTHMKKEAENVSLEFPLWVMLICGVIVASSLEATFNRVNIILIPLTFFIAVATYEIPMLFTDRACKKISSVLFLTYAVFLVFFFAYYITDYDEIVEEVNGKGMEYALEYVKENLEESTNVYVLSSYLYIDIAYYTALSPTVYKDTVVYAEPEGELPSPISFGNYDFSTQFNDGDGLPDSIEEGAMYLCSHEDHDYIKWMRDNNIEVNYFNAFVVGHYRGE